MTGWEVLDSAVKIGLGALITAVSGYLVLMKNHDHEEEKENRKIMHDLREEKKLKCSQFLTQIHAINFKVLRENKKPDQEMMKDFMKVYSEITLISNNDISDKAYEIMINVNSIILTKEGDRGDLPEKIGSGRKEFEKMVRDEILKGYPSDS